MGFGEGDDWEMEKSGDFENDLGRLSRQAKNN